MSFIKEDPLLAGTVPLIVYDIWRYVTMLYRTETFENEMREKREKSKTTFENRFSKINYGEWSSEMLFV